MRRWFGIFLIAAVSAPVWAVTPAEQLAGYSAQAGSPGNVARGQAFFTQKHGGEWSCASCHNASPGTSGRHANTGKVLAPLAPAFNPERFTDARKTEKWFRRNCNDVLNRECSAGEKADVMAYLLSIR